MKFYITKNGALARSGECPEGWVSIQAASGEVAHVGEVPPELLPPPPPAATLNELKATKWGRIKASLKGAVTGGFTAGGYTWDSDADSQQAMMLTLQDMAEAGGPATVKWMTADGQLLPLTAAQLRGLARALRQHVQTQREKAATLRTQIAAATTKAELDAITW
jgi:hypothetical protein